MPIDQAWQTPDDRPSNVLRAMSQKPDHPWVKHDHGWTCPLCHRSFAEAGDQCDGKRAP